MPKTNDLPGMTGLGLSPVRIPAIEKAATNYERQKDARCRETPREIAAKGELKELLHKHRDELPFNTDGNRFYRFTYDDDKRVDYILDEVLKRRNCGDDDGSGTQPAGGAAVTTGGGDADGDGGTGSAGKPTRKRGKGVVAGRR